MPFPSQALKVRAADTVLAVFEGVALTSCTRVVASANNSRADVVDGLLVALLQFAPLSVLKWSSRPLATAVIAMPRASWLSVSLISSRGVFCWVSRMRSRTKMPRPISPFCGAAEMAGIGIRLPSKPVTRVGEALPATVTLRESVELEKGDGLAGVEPLPVFTLP